MKKPLIVFLLTFLAISCSDFDVAPLNTTSLVPVQEPQVINGKLAFVSTAHLNEFIEHAKQMDWVDFKKYIKSKEEGSSYKSFLPYIEDHEEDKLLEYREFRIKDYNKIRRRGQDPNLFSAAIDIDEPEIDLTEDELIADPYFASIVNSGRQIIVDQDLYVYNQYATFHSNYDNESLLLEVIDDVGLCSSILNQSGTVDMGEGIYAEISVPVNSCSTYGVNNPTSTTNSNTISNTQTTSDDSFSKNKAIIDNLQLCEDSFGIWDVFGPTKTCIDKFSSGDHRIKTKTWAQNYLVYSSVGLKVKGQKKRWGIWTAHDVSELELGYSAASFEYSIPNYTLGGSSSSQLAYEFNGVLVDVLGNKIVPPFKVDFKELFKTFPISDPNKNLIRVYLPAPLKDVLNNLDASLFDNNGAIDLKAKVVNKELERLAENGFKQLTKAIGKEINGPVVFVYPNLEWNKVHFVYINWYKNKGNENKMNEIFSWNFAIKVNLSAPSFNVKSVDGAAVSYSKFNIVCYGIGRKGSEWRGSKVSIKK